MPCYQSHREHPICDAFDQRQTYDQKPWSPAEGEAEHNGICLSSYQAEPSARVVERTAKHRKAFWRFKRGHHFFAIMASFLIVGAMEASNATWS